MTSLKLKFKLLIPYRDFLLVLLILDSARKCSSVSFFKNACTLNLLQQCTFFPTFNNLRMLHQLARIYPFFHIETARTFL